MGQRTGLGGRREFGEEEDESSLPEITLVKIAFDPGEPSLQQNTTTGSGEVALGATLQGLSRSGKIELAYGRGYKSPETPADVVVPMSGTRRIEATFTVDAHAGARGGVSANSVVGLSRTDLRLRAGAFAGVRAAQSTEFVLMAGTKQLAKLKGGPVLTFGVGGEWEGSWTWGDGSIGFKSKGWLSLGPGAGWDIDFQVNVPSLMTWLWQNGWDWASWAGRGVGSGLYSAGSAVASGAYTAGSAVASGLYSAGSAGIRGVSSALWGLASAYSYVSG